MQYSDETRAVFGNASVAIEYNTVRHLAIQQLHQAGAVALQMTGMKAAAICWVSGRTVDLLSTQGLGQHVLTQLPPRDLTWFMPTLPCSSDDQTVIDPIQGFLGVNGYRYVLSLPIFAYSGEVMGAMLLLDTQERSQKADSLELLNSLIHMAMVGIDATRALKHCQATQQELTAMVNQLPLILLRTNQFGQLDFIGGGAFTEWQKQGILSKDTNYIGDEVFAQEVYSPALQEAIRQAMQGQTIHTILEWRDQTLSALLCPIDPQYPAQGVLGIGLDITLTDKKQTEYRILERAVQNSNELILITDAQSELPGPQIVFANQALLKQTGYEISELLGQTPRVLQGSQTNRAMLSELKLALKRRQPFHGQTTNYRKDGSTYMVEWDISPVLDQTGTTTHFLSIQRDISERVKLEQLLKDLRNSLEGNQNSKNVEQIKTQLIAAQAQLKNGRMQGQLENLGGAIILLQMLSVAHSSGAIHFEQTEYAGTLYLQHGRIVAVEHPSQTGKTAIMKLLRLEQGGFLFDTHATPKEYSLDLDPTALSLELARDHTQWREPQHQVTLSQEANTAQNNVLILPQMDAAINFMRGVGGEAHFTASLEMQTGWADKKLILRGRGFTLIIVRGDMSLLPESVARA